MNHLDFFNRLENMCNDVETIMIVLDLIQRGDSGIGELRKIKKPAQRIRENASYLQTCIECSDALEHEAAVLGWNLERLHLIQTQVDSILTKIDNL
jgi:hypothetical protein